MPESIITIKIKYENNVAFSVEAKDDEATFKTVVKAEEDGSLVKMWPAFTEVMRKYIDNLMSKIGKKMAEP